MADFFEGWGSYDGNSDDAYAAAPASTYSAENDDAYAGIADGDGKFARKGLFVTASVFYGLWFVFLAALFAVINIALHSPSDSNSIVIINISFSGLIGLGGMFTFVAFILVAVGLPKTYTKVVFILGTIFTGTFIQVGEMMITVVNPIIQASGGSEMPSSVKSIISMAVTVFVLIWVACLIAMIVKDKSFRGVGGLGQLATTVIMYVITIFFPNNDGALYAYFFFLLLNAGSMVVLCCEIPNYYGAASGGKEEYTCESGDDIGESFSPLIEGAGTSVPDDSASSAASTAEDKADNGGVDDFFANFM